MSYWLCKCSRLYFSYCMIVHSWKLFPCKIAVKAWCVMLRSSAPRNLWNKMLLITEASLWYIIRCVFVCKDVFDVLYILRNSRGEISLTEFDKASENQYLAVNRINIQPQSQWKYQTAWESDHSCSLMHQKYYSEWVWMWYYFCFIHHTGNGRNVECSALWDTVFQLYAAVSQMK